MDGSEPTNSITEGLVDRGAADVSPSRRGEAAYGDFGLLRLLQSTFRSVDTHLGIPLFWLNSELRYQWVNESFTKFINRSRNEIVGRHVSELFEGEGARARIQAGEQALESGRAVTVTVHEQFGGRPVAHELIRVPIRDDDGTMLGIAGIDRDVSTQAALVAGLEQDRMLLDVLMDVLPDSIYFKDTECRFRRINRATAEKFGIATTEEAIGKSDFDIFSQEHAQEAFDDERRILETGAPIVAKEEKETWPDGTVSWVSTTKVPVAGADGRPLGTFGVTRDVTRRKQAQEALEASERRFRELIDNANDIIYTHDLSGRFLTFNNAAEATTGFTRDEAMNLNVRDMVVPEHLALATEMTRRKLQGVAATTYEIDLKGKHGQRIPVELSTRILYEDGKPVAVQGIGRDITERRRASEELARQASLLSDQAHELERRNAELSHAYRELQEAESQLIHSEKMAAIGQLVAGLAHEINNPAAFVLTNLTTIERDVADLLEYQRECDQILESGQGETARGLMRETRDRLAVDTAVEEISQLLNSCRNGMHRIRDLVTNLRAYSRIDTRGSFEIADLEQGVEATLVLLRPVIPKTVAVEVRAEDVPSIECNLGQINQIFMNLLVNAIDAVGGSGQIWVHIERAREGVAVRFVDNGKGISEDIRRKIFDPFFTTKEVGKGTGLGLTICQKIVEAHKGRIDVESELGHGTEFRVWLPLRQSTTENV